MFVNFREPELESLIISDISDDWKNIVETLQLTGQKSLTERKSKTSEEEVSNPNPYMPLNKRWMKIFKTMCPTSVNYKDYAFSVMPYQALEEIALCVEKNFFDEIEIWYDEVAKDPLIVGVVRGKYSWDNKYFLVGRFGDEILPLEMIEKKAKERMIAHLRNAVAKVSKTIEESVQSYLDNDNNLTIRISDAHPHVN